MDTRQVNYWSCQCGNWCEADANERRWPMDGSECIELGNTVDKYALYRCWWCGSESWSRVIEIDDDGNEVPLSCNPLIGEAN